MMRNYANHGYVEKASELTQFLPAEVKAEYEETLKNGDWETCHRILMENLPEEIVKPVSCFTYTDEVDSDDLEMGEIYAIWQEEQLYNKVENAAMKLLQKHDVVPVMSQWVTFG